MGKMWWQDQRPQIKPWVVDKHRDPCDCSQYVPLRVTGISMEQGPTHYCPVCKWAFWSVIQRPTAAQLGYEQRTNPKASVESMSYIKLCNKPKAAAKTTKTIMIEQLGGHMPTFLTEALKEYWINEFCKLFPNSWIAKSRAAKKKAEDEKNDRGYY